MAPRYPVVVVELLIKARSSALLAVQTYNSPTVEFRVQAFIMLMHVAWNSLFLATFLRDRRKPFYRRPNGYNYVYVHGERMTWDLSECIRQYWTSDTTPARANLEFFVGLRNKIEHYRDQSVLSIITFGECQSLVTNFEDALLAEFGSAYALTEYLSLSIQLSTFRSAAREDAILKSVDRSTRGVLEFISEFRSSLSDDVFSDMRFSHKLFLLPKTANHRSRDSLAVEWLDIDDLSPEDVAEVDKTLAIIKQRYVEVRNKGSLLPADVCERVRTEMGLEAFTPSFHHVQCWKFFKARPTGNAMNPYACKTEFCQYDQAFDSYVYTEAWVGLLLEELSDSARYQEIMAYRS